MLPSHAVAADDYVNHSYDRVRSALVADPNQVFRRATAGSADDSALRVGIAGLDIAVDTAIDVVRVEEDDGRSVLVLHLDWRAVRHPAVFPRMTATLRVFPLTATETQLALEGTYTPPFGPVGAMLDAAAGHRLAAAAVTTFVRQVAAYLREQLVESPVARLSAR